MKAAKGRGGVSSVQSASISAPRALCTSLAPCIIRWTVRTRSTGSATSVGIDVKRFDTWFPEERSPTPPTETGTPAISGRAGSRRPKGPHGPAEQLEIGWHLVGPPAVPIAVAVTASGRGIEDAGQHGGGGHPVGGGVVDLGHHTDVAVLQTLDHPQLPQR